MLAGIEYDQESQLASDFTPIFVVNPDTSYTFDNIHGGTVQQALWSHGLEYDEDDQNTKLKSFFMKKKKKPEEQVVQESSLDTIDEEAGTASEETSALQRDDKCEYMQSITVERDMRGLQKDGANQAKASERT